MEPDKTEIGVAFISHKDSEGKHSSTTRTSEESPWPFAVPWTIHWWLPLNAARPTVLPKKKCHESSSNRKHCTLTKKLRGSLTKKWRLHPTKWRKVRKERNRLSIVAYPCPTTWTSDAMTLLTSEQMVSAAGTEVSLGRASEGSDPTGHDVWPQ